MKLLRKPDGPLLATKSVEKKCVAKPTCLRQKEAPLTAIEKTLKLAPDTTVSKTDLVDHLLQVIGGLQLGEAVPIEATKAALALAHEAEQRIADLTARVTDLEKLATTDELTGVLNRRGFEAAFERVMEQATRYDETGVLVFIDLDGFKPVNDVFGHAAGDEILKTVARILRDNVRNLDCVARVGGDEFAVLLTRTNWIDGIARAEFLDLLLNAAVIDWHGRSIPVSASLGYKTFGPRDERDSLLQAADAVMYARKEAGRMAGRSQRTHA